MPSNIETGLELDEVGATCGHAYIARITDAATIEGDACTIGIFLLKLDLTHKHLVENFFYFISRDVFKYNDAEGVRSLHASVLGTL